MSIRKTYHKIDIESFDEKKYFSEFHYYEIYKPLGKYTEGKFMADYGKGLLTYYHQIYVLCHNEGKMFYVVSIEKLFKNERFLLSDFCNCTYCQSNVFVQLTSKPNNNGCLIYDKYPRQKYIDEAKIARHNYYNKK